MTSKNDLMDMLSGGNTAAEALDHKFSPDVIVTEDGEEVKCYNAFMPTEVDEYEEYYDILKLLRSHSVVGHHIDLFIAGWGGCTLLGNSFINALNACRAQVQLTVTADVYSMHTVIALSQARNLVIEDNVQLMFHESQMGMAPQGLSNNLRDLLAAKNSDKMMDKYLKPFLTTEEYKEINAGLNVYVTGPEMKKRIAKKFAKKVRKPKSGTIITPGDSE